MVKRNDRIRNERFWERLMVLSIGDKIRKACLRWFGLVQRKSVMTLVRKSFSMQVDGPPRGRARPKRMWMEVVTN